MHLQFKKLFIHQQFNDPTMFFKHAEITVPSIAIKSTSFFYVRKAQTDKCPIFPDMAALSHSCYLYQLQTLESSTSHSHFCSLCLSVWLHICTDFSKDTHYSRPLSLALIWSVQSGKTHSSIPSQAVSDLFQLQLVFNVCVCQLGVIMLLITSPLCGIKLRGMNYKQYPWQLILPSTQMAFYRIQGEYPLLETSLFSFSYMTIIRINKGPHDQNVVFTHCAHGENTKSKCGA